jgi:hypothetical protein
MGSVEAHFQSCYRNRALKAHIRQVQLILDEMRCEEPAPAMSTRYEPCSHHHSIRHQMPTYRSVFEAKCVPALSSPPTLSVLTEMGSYLSSSEHNLKSDSLQQLFGEFSHKQDNPLHRLYGTELEQSHRSLVAEASPPAVQLCSEDTLVAFERDTSSHLNAVFDTISRSLSPCDQGEKVLQLAGIWPRFTPRALLDQLAFTPESDVATGWKKALIVYAHSLLALQLSRRLLSLFRMQKWEELKKELETCLIRHNIEHSDWLLIQVSWSSDFRSYTDSASRSTTISLSGTFKSVYVMR